MNDAMIASMFDEMVFGFGLSVLSLVGVWMACSRIERANNLLSQVFY
jgi:hypothetical protein